MLVRSPADSEFLAAILNADPTSVVGDDSHSPGVVRYSAVPGRRGTTLIHSDDRGRDRGVIRPGIVGVTPDRALAERSFSV
jgi:hypothetical protein